MRALITGASSGIGFELSKIFAKNNYDLVMVSKDRKKLESSANEIKSLHNVTIKQIAIDLSKENSARKLYYMLPGKIDILVNNAGFGLYGEFKDTDISAEQEMLHLNIVSLTELTKYIMKDMLAKGSGKIMNIASTAAFFPGPMMSVYYASKAYVLSFSVALANELKGTNVSLTVVCPGPTKSGFQEKANLGKSSFSKHKMMGSDEVAEISYKGLIKKQLIIIPGTMNKFQAFASRIFPMEMLADMVRSYQKQR